MVSVGIWLGREGALQDRPDFSIVDVELPIRRRVYARGTGRVHSCHRPYQGEGKVGGTVVRLSMQL